MNGCRLDPAFAPGSVTQTLNAWALGEAARAVAEVTGAIEAYRFNDAANAAYRFVWNVFCDWYLELAKPVLQGEDGPAKEETRRTIAFIIDQICVLLHPFMPFLTEELWATKAREAGLTRPLLALAAWPDLGGLAKPEAEAEIGWVVDLVSEIRSARSETNVPAGAQIPLVLVAPGEAVRERLSRWGDTVRRLGRIASIETVETSPRNAVQLIVRGEVAALPLEGVVDLAAEVARLKKEDAKLDGEIGKIDAKLGNADFLARAPEEVVEEQRERRDAAIARREKVRDALTRLQG